MQKESWTEKLGRIISTCGNAILMNLLFLAACLPIVTIGQAWCGLLGAIRYNIRGEKWIEGFKVGFKTRFLRGTIFWIAGLLVGWYFLADVNAAVKFMLSSAAAKDAIAPLMAAAVMFALAAMVTLSALLLNVYIPTSVSDWIKNTVNLIFKAPLQMLIAAAAFCAPVVVMMVIPYGFLYIYELALVLLCAYFTLVALAFTLLMKNALLSTLVQARQDGTLTAEEGKMPQSE